jgi:hypothetical protein
LWLKADAKDEKAQAAWEKARAEYLVWAHFRLAELRRHAREDQTDQVDDKADENLKKKRDNPPLF